MAGRGGFVPGSGRKKGSKNKSTIQKELVAKEVLARNAMTIANAGDRHPNTTDPNVKLATKVLEEFMMLFAGMAATHQPLPDGMPVPQGRKPDEDKFLRYAELTRDTAKALAPYQSPTFKAMSVSVNPTEQQPTRPGDNAKIIDLKDAKVMGQVYMRLIKSGASR
jgi:hypothetical protein